MEVSLALSTETTDEIYFERLCEDEWLYPFEPQMLVYSSDIGCRFSFEAVELTGYCLGLSDLGT